MIIATGGYLSVKGMNKYYCIDGGLKYTKYPIFAISASGCDWSAIFMFDDDTDDIYDKDEMKLNNIGQSAVLLLPDEMILDNDGKIYSFDNRDGLCEEWKIPRLYDDKNFELYNDCGKQYIFYPKLRKVYVADYGKHSLVDSDVDEVIDLPDRLYFFNKEKMIVNGIDISWAYGDNFKILGSVNKIFIRDNNMIWWYYDTDILMKFKKLDLVIDVYVYDYSTYVLKYRSGYKIVSLDRSGFLEIVSDYDPIFTDDFVAYIAYDGKIFIARLDIDMKLNFIYSGISISVPGIVVEMKKTYDVIFDFN